MPDPREIVRICSSLIKITTRQREERYTSRDDENGADQNDIIELQLAHFSVKEYLVSERVAECFQTDFREPYARAVIVEVSIAYLLAGAPDTLDNDAGIQLPLQRFSAEYWMDHAALAERDGEYIWPCVFV